MIIALLHKRFLVNNAGSDSFTQVITTEMERAFFEIVYFEEIVGNQEER